jgi:hypothetical protein
MKSNREKCKIMKYDLSGRFMILCLGRFNTLRSKLKSDDVG